VIENIQVKQFSFEDKLAELVRDIHNGIKDVENKKKNTLDLILKSQILRFVWKTLKHIY